MSKGTCKVEGCDRPHRARGFCAKHYYQWRDSDDCDPAEIRVTNPGALCSEVGCEKPAQSRGLCSMHYTRVLRHGSTAKPTRNIPPLSERFWAKVNKDGPVPAHMPHLGQCWEWTASTDSKGYGHLTSDSRSRTAHRVAWELLVGPIPPDKPHVLHHCDNPACVRADPDPEVSHTFLGTAQDNSDDKIAKGRDHHSRKTECKNGHPYDEVGTYTDARGCRRCLKCRSELTRKRRERRRAAAGG